MKKLIPFLILFFAVPVLGADYQPIKCSHIAAATTVDAINTAILLADPGETICVPDGTITNPGTISIGATLDGTEANPITLRPITPGGVIFTGVPTGVVIQADADWWVIEDFTITDLSKSGATNTQWIDSLGDNVRVTNNYFTGFGKDNDAANRNWAIWMEGLAPEVDHNTFDGCKAVEIVVKSTATGMHVHHNAIKNSINATANGNEGIYIGDDSNWNTTCNGVIEYNYFEDIGGTGEKEIISIKCADNTIRYNVFREVDNSEHGGIVFRGGHRQTVYGNFLIGGGAHGMVVYGDDHVIYNNYFTGQNTSAIYFPTGDDSSYPKTDTVLIAYNTIINPSQYYAIWIGYGATTAPTNLTFVNNFLYSDDSNSTYLVLNTAVGTMTWDTNMYHITGTASAWSGSGQPSGTDYESISTPNLAVGYGIYRLQATGDLIGAGTPVGGGYAISITDDLEQDTRDETNPDIGMDEYSASAPTITKQKIIDNAGHNFNYRWRRTYISN